MDMQRTENLLLLERLIETAESDAAAEARLRKLIHGAATNAPACELVEMCRTVQELYIANLIEEADNN